MDLGGGDDRYSICQEDIRENAVKNFRTDDGESQQLAFLFFNGETEVESSDNGTFK